MGGSANIFLGGSLATPGILSFTCCRRVRADGCVFAVKRLSALHHIEFPFLLENEVNGLGHANYRKIPRVVKFEELILLPDGDTRVVLE